MADTRVLLSGLEEYHRVLGMHLSKLTAEFQQLDNTWRNFSAVYEGEAADQFREGWIRTTQRFQEYIEQTQKISMVLNERIEHLREANRSEGGLIG
ncbi:MAG: WXG100 family type VII secretion target [Anaerolineales bacterium]|nr:WXG100 family type VII secretion target [Anaerolineales bacterium]